MPTREEIVEEGLTWLDTKWIHQASLKGVGTDCIGLIAGIARNKGIKEAVQWDNDLEFHGYGMMPEPTRLNRACAKYLDFVPLDQIRKADILVFTLIKEPMHFALVTAVNPLYMLHAYWPTKCVTRNIVDTRWRGRLLRAHSYRGLD